ncbi:type VII secretion target [Nocardia sp. NPDC050710]|uniref:type VII secretion target n=1 Tax=Nocardia sp. NPDC050710 TaxID=3157220 RepID=UPI0033EDEB49
MGQEVSVATDALRSEGKAWARESDTLDKVKSDIQSIGFNRVEAGVFQAIVSAHAEVVEKMTTLSGQAATSFDKVGQTLQTCADTYDAEDAAGKHRIDNLW